MLEVYLLGRFEVKRDDQPVEITSRPAQSLFAYLALNPNTAHRRERLAGLLWPDSSDANARRNLRQTLWQIRRAISSDALITSDDLTIAFNPLSDYRLDADSIMREVDGCTADDLIAMVSAYGGELLPGFYDDWVVLERERLHAQFERKMGALMDRLTEAQRWQDVLQWGERWIGLGNTPEPAYRALMTAHAAFGDASKMAETYRRCAEALQRDLGVEPSPQTQALFERLRAGQHVGSPPAPSPIRTPALLHNLPVQLTSFIGRDKEIAEIRQRLQSSRLLTLTGAGGTGKTRLAVQVANQLLDVFADGAWLIELATLTDPDLIPQTVASALGVREQPDHPLMQSLTEYLRPKSALLILDNCEHLVEACAPFIETLLRACPNVKVLVTSRETLGLTGESVFRVPSLTLPNLRSGQLPALDELVQFESIRLFVDRAAAVRPEFKLTQANAPAVAQICQRLDGVPLAIELAAARVRAMTVEQIATRLDDRFRLLTGGSRTALPRQQTLLALIDWSWDLLSDDERTLLRRLSAFVDGWTLEAAEQVCKGAEVQGREGAVISPTPLGSSAPVLDVLTHLVEKSLVIAEERGAETRYSLLETIRQYARDKLLEAGEAECIRARHLQFFLKLSEKAEPKLRAADQLIWLDRLEAEHGNLRAALQWAASSEDGEDGLRLAGSLARFWYLHGYWNEGREWLRLMLLKNALQNAGEGAPFESLARAQIKALCGAGWLADENGSEFPLYTEALALSRQIGDRWSEAYSLRGLVSGVLNWDRSEHVITRLNQSLEIFRSLGDAWGIGLALYSLGWIAVDTDRLAQAKEIWQEGLASFQRVGDRWGQAVTINALGYISRTDGNYPRAAELTRESLALFRELGDKAGIVMSLTRLGHVALRRGDFAEAASLLEESLTVQREHVDRFGVVDALMLLGLTLCYQGEYVRAETALQEGLTLAREADARRDIPHFLSYLGLVAYNENDLSRAESLWQESAALHGEVNDQPGVLYALRSLGAIAMQRGDYHLADERLASVLAALPADADRRTRAMSLHDAGELARRTDDWRRARDSFRESLGLHKKIGDKHGIAKSLEGIAGLLDDADADQSMQATQLIATAQALRQAIGAPLPPVERADLDRHIESLRTKQGEATFESAWTEGQAMSPEAAGQHALASLERLATAASA